MTKDRLQELLLKIDNKAILPKCLTEDRLKLAFSVSNSISDVLSSTFTWSASFQGYKFWLAVWTKLLSNRLALEKEII